MKVGIITFHRAINYGAVLQTYALQAALDKLDIASEVIDYRCPKIEETYREYRSKEALRHGRPLLYLQYNRKNEKFSRFSQNIFVSAAIVIKTMRNCWRRRTGTMLF